MDYDTLLLVSSSPWVRPDHVLQERLGHSSSRVTRDVYGHVLPVVDDAVTNEIDKLFRDPSRTDRARRTSWRNDESEDTHRDQGKFQWSRVDVS
jgi:hypothetical protein